jgi:hypothetical protein
MQNNHSFIKLWSKPILLGALSLFGLIMALVGDGIWDAASWIALGIPVVVMIRYYFKPTPSQNEQ